MKAKYFLQLVGLSALWSSSFMLLRITSPLLGPNVLTAVRLGLATLTLAIIMQAMRYRWPWQHWRELLLLGLLPQLLMTIPRLHRRLLLLLLYVQFG